MMQVMNEKTLKRDTWNMFVGEARYKTNFFLQFLDQATAALFQRQNLHSSTVIYSVRCLLLAYWFLLQFFDDRSNSLSTLLFLVLLFLASLSGTTEFVDLEKHNFRYLNNAKFKQSLIVSLLNNPLILFVQLLLPIYASFRLFDQNGGETCPFYPFYLPTFLVSNLVLSDWLEFSIVCIFQNIIALRYFE